MFPLFAEIKKNCTLSKRLFVCTNSLYTKKTTKPIPKTIFTYCSLRHQERLKGIVKITFENIPSAISQSRSN